jgi:DNA polymerase IV
MRIACIHFPNFLYQVERLSNPDMEDKPVIVGGIHEGQDRVADCSEEAAALGVVSGMALREAYYRCPDALLLPFSNRYDSAWESILFALGAYGSRIGSSVPGVAYLDITKAAKICRDERKVAFAIIRDLRNSSLLKARIGIGNSRFIARQAALCAWDALIIEPGSERDFLSLMSIEALPIKENEVAHLRLLGLTTLKKVSSVSKKALVSQFGLTGAALFEIANGLSEKKSIPRRQGALSLERESTSDTPLYASSDTENVRERMINEPPGELRRARMISRGVAVAL